MCHMDSETGEEILLNTLHEGEYFGEMALFKEDLRSASCIATSDTVLLTLDREDFITTIGKLEDLMYNPTVEQQRQILMASVYLNREDSMQVSVKNITSVNVKRANQSNMRLDDLEMLTTLGMGAFGLVRLCRRKKDHTQYFALKCQSKDSIVSDNRQAKILSEISIMREVEHPFIATLFAALQDNSYIYFVLELLPGGELYSQLKRNGELSELNARFYVAITATAFNVIHEKGIAYRDLKPVSFISAVVVLGDVFVAPFSHKYSFVITLAIFLLVFK